MCSNKKYLTISQAVCNDAGSIGIRSIARKPPTKGAYGQSQGTLNEIS